VYYLRHLCFFTYSGVQHILCCVFDLFCSSSCVPYVANFSELFVNQFTSCQKVQTMVLHMSTTVNFWVFHLSTPIIHEYFICHHQ
jgi:hypothetical protein